LPLAGSKLNLAPFWLVRVKLGAGALDSRLPISPFFGGSGMCANTGLAKATLKQLAINQRLMRCDLKIISNIQLFGALGKIAVNQISTGEL